MIALAAFITAGSVYARVGHDIVDSFLIAGTYMLFAPMAAYLLIRSADPHRLANGFVWVLGLASLVVITQLGINFGVRQVHHELEFLVPPLALVFVFMQPRRRWHWAAIALFVFAALLFRKNTGYLAALLIVAYAVALNAWPRWRRQPGLIHATKTRACGCNTCRRIACSVCRSQSREISADWEHRVPRVHLLARVESVSSVAYMGYGVSPRRDRRTSRCSIRVCPKTSCPHIATCSTSRPMAVSLG